MARKKKKKDQGGGVAPWLITFSDMMTLMLTFFVLLVSMSTMDERRRLIVLGSLIGTFGIGAQGYDDRTVIDKRTTIEPGPMEDLPDLEPLKDLLWEDLEDDIDFQSNKYVQIVSLNEDVLFEPGQVHLKQKGLDVLNRILPVLLEIEHPVLLAGYTSTWRDEFSDKPITTLMDEDLDPSWDLSLQRILSMYRFFLDGGVHPDNLRLEAFGRFRPKYNELDPEGRQRNRRVDIVLDRRNDEWIKKYEDLALPEESSDQSFSYRDFLFDLFKPDATPQD